MDKPFIFDQLFEKQDFCTVPLAKGEYENCIFRGCRFSDAFLDNQNFMECTFEECDLTNANITHTIFKETFFKGCKLVGLRFEDCNDFLMSVRFEGCNLTLASFNDLSLKETPFIDCTLTQTDFTGADLSRSTFPGCTMENTLFHTTNLEGADLSSALGFDIDPSINTLKKCKFSKEGLIGLLKKYDIVVT
ncbi:pentapeptide repeat-containing protein [Flagellimonas amoyensis]|uniref:pentapeptide repeat-containing protein n=1 Tax=Flagellimonas amoyensis TaxID=2169401 RepID=UPI000D3CEE9C|nr:pentapeptide repeat-containing protein [Allomuricauda amoyensis]